MPRKDPITGCMVMTRAEFWASEAEHEGKGRSGSDLRDEFYEDMERERLECEQRLRDPAEARRLIESCRLKPEDDPEEFDPEVLEVLEVVEAHFSQSLRESTESVVARVHTAEGERLVKAVSWASTGSFYEPPDAEAYLEWM